MVTRACSTECLNTRLPSVYSAQYEYSVNLKKYRKKIQIKKYFSIISFTGNNTTMEMDITESSSFITEETPESPYLSGLRSIRGRRSYKPLKEMNLRNISINRSTRSAASGEELTFFYLIVATFECCIGSLSTCVVFVGVLYRLIILFFFSLY